MIRGQPADLRDERASADDTVIVRTPEADDTVIVRTPDADDTVVVKDATPDDTVVVRTVEVERSGVVPGLRLPSRVRARLRVRRDADQGDERPHRLLELPALGLAPELLALSTLGVALVAVAYVAGRAEVGWAMVAYWAGHVLVYTPVVLRLLSRHVTAGESFLLAIGLAVNQYMLKWMYSPDQFRFPDELQHWLSTTVVVEGGRLFRPNTALPVAAHFPGLEEIGAAVSALTGLPVTASGMLVAGVLHLAFVGALFMTVRRAGGSPSMAGAACAIYATAMHYLFFDSMYIYQTAALPFLMLTVWASRAWRGREPGFVPYAVVGVVSVAVATVSHHVTAVAMIATLVLLAACELVTRRRRASTPVLAAVAVAAVAAWFVLVAREIFDYLGPPLDSMTESATRVLAGQQSQTSVAPGNPPWQLAVQAVSLAALLIVLARATWVAWRRRDRDPWRLALIVGSFLFFATSALRFVGDQGPELSGRASTFTYVPMSLLAAATIVEWRRSLRPRSWPGALGRWAADARWASPALLGAAMATLLMVSARLGGWPAHWGLLPGPYLAAGYERAVDAPGVGAAWWMHDNLGEGNRVGADLTGVTLASTYGRQEPVRESATLYYDRVWRLRDQRSLDQYAIEYLWVDLRLSEQRPVSGAYFADDPRANRHTTPIPRESLTKFDELPGVNLVYDNGSIRIYDLRGA